MAKFPFWTVLLALSLIFLYPFSLPGVPPLEGLLTFHFSHASPDHLLQNVLALLLFGSALESKEGNRVLMISFLSSLLGGLAGLAFGGGRGFSAGIFGILGYLLSKYPGLDILGIPASAFGFGYSLYNLLFQDPSISALGHAVGFLAGMAMAGKWDWFAGLVAVLNILSAVLWVVRFI